MDHAEVLEALELAAAEPDGLGRLGAGDTPEAAAVAGHLAGCDACAREALRLGRLSALVRAAVAEPAVPVGTGGNAEDVPPDVRDDVRAPEELRERTLALVAAVGRPRGPLASEAAPSGALRTAQPAVPRGAGGGPAAPAPTAAEAPMSPVPIRAIPSARRGAGRWASLAAAVVLAVAATGLVAGALTADRLARGERAIEGLASVSAATLKLSAAPDVERVGLVPVAAEGQGSGTLLFSPSSREVIVVMTGYEEPGVGREYRCWVDVDGQRTRVGRMYFGGGLGYWVGVVDALAGAGAGTMFGVNLVDAGSDAAAGTPVLRGVLAS